MYYGMWRIGMDAVESVKPDFRKDGHIKAVRQNNDHRDAIRPGNELVGQKGIDILTSALRTRFSWFH
jgi:hypothetical protein